jgi:hypothetical protein
MKHVRMAALARCLALAMTLASAAQAQQLEPRAYAPAPVGLNVAGIAYGELNGEVLLDPSVPVENVEARIRVTAPYYAHSFELYGQQAGVSVMLPFADLSATGDVQGEGRSIARGGAGDPALRFALNLIGSPALSPKEFATRTRETIVGTSLTVVAPFGQYDPSRLINLGANRWAFKPELGLSQPLGDWDLELYAGVWVFTDNDNFYGGQRRQQAPLVTTQGHVVYTFLPNAWVSLDYTYYTGGATTVGGQAKDDRNDNSRTGVTFALPVAKQQSLKLSWSRGVSVRVGQNFDTIGLSWSYAWF